METPVSELAKRRYSCRRYLDRPLSEAHRKAVEDSLASIDKGPSGNRCRFALIASTPGDMEALKGLGTYGFIRNAAGFIVGAVRPAPGDMEDCGYCLERTVMDISGLGLGTCWLGGTFTRSSFARRISIRADEVIPAVIAVGYPSEKSPEHWMRRMASGNRRLPSERLFFDGDPDSPLDISQVGDLAQVLEVVRWAPSASNKQPWRLVRSGDAWHFFLERTSNPRKRGAHSLIKMEDVQRVDMGIAMCHFDLAAREVGMDGHWSFETPEDPGLWADKWEYTASWVAS